MSHPPSDSEAALTPEPTLTSFVLRFVQTEPGASDWHGLVRHIQSDTERAFTRWEDAVAFITQYVPITDDKVT